MVTLITDRRKSHVTRLKLLASKGWVNMTPYERSEWLGEIGDTTKGAYNYTDLNRVETAVQELSDKLELGLTTKTDWNEWDVPKSKDMERYLGNVVAIRDSYATIENFPVLPNSMDNLTYEMANNIEKTLDLVYSALGESSGVLGAFILGESILATE